MAAATKNLVFEQGAAFKLRLTWLDSNRVAVDLTGYTAKMQVRSAAGGALLVEASTTNGYIVLGGAAGTVDINIPEATIAALSFSSAVYDLVLTPAAGGPLRFIQGKVAWSPGVTQ